MESPPLDPIQTGPNTSTYRHSFSGDCDTEKPGNTGESAHGDKLQNLESRVTCSRSNNKHAIRTNKQSKFKIDRWVGRRF